MMTKSYLSNNHTARRARCVGAVLAIFAPVLASGCTSTSGFSASNLLPGSQQSQIDTASAIITGLNGGLVSQLNARLSRVAVQTAVRAEYQVLEYTAPGDIVNWVSPDGSGAGQVVGSQPYRVGSQDCRQYRQTVTSQGAPQTITGTACRTADGAWELLGRDSANTIS